MPLNDTERTARAMSKRERVTYLTERGWMRTDSTGSQSWEDPAGAGLCTLDVAVRLAIEDDTPPADRPSLRAQVELNNAAAQLPMGMAPFACVSCHATEHRLGTLGHIGSCRAELRHRHRMQVPIEHCEHWLLYGKRDAR